MTRSKLETYLVVLKVLINNGPSKISRIAQIANLNSDVLTEYLDFLIKQSSVEERTFGSENTEFAITKHGVSLLKYFGQLKELSISEKEK
jgi:predicted transcriptional regulator